MSSVQDHRFNEEGAEQLLGALAGIVSAHIVTDGAGQIVEVHILAAPELHPKQVVRNVESALSAGLGIQIDRRIVSVAQIRTEGANGQRAAAPVMAHRALVDGTGEDRAGDSAEPDPPTPGATSRPVSRRLEYVRYHSRRSRDRCTCQVVLRSGEEEVTGTGQGPDTAAGRAEAAAGAVFDALGRARPEVRVRLEAATISASRGRTFVLISAHAVMDRTTTPLAGAAAVTRSAEEAAILAALQASNRWSG